MEIVLVRSVIPQSPVLDQIVRVTESKQSVNTTISWVYDGGANDMFSYWTPPILPK